MMDAINGRRVCGIFSFMVRFSGDGTLQLN